MYKNLVFVWQNVKVAYVDFNNFSGEQKLTYFGNYI